MRKSASEIINDLETRVANLEKEAIFGLFERKRKPKTLKEQNEARLRKEQKEEARLQKERDRKEERKRERLEKKLRAYKKKIQNQHETFLEDVQYELYKDKKVDEIDVDMVKGNLTGTMTVRGFVYKIQSELDEVGLRGGGEFPVDATLFITGPGLRKTFETHWKYNDNGDQDVGMLVKRIVKRVYDAYAIANSDKVTIDRAEAKRMRKEKYRLANRKQASYSSSLDLRLLEESREGYTSLTTKALMRLNEHEMNVDSTDESPLGARQGVIEFDEMVDLLDKRSRSRAEDKLLLDYANEVVRQFGNLGIV